jgi:hypothetical protein
MTGRQDYAQHRMQVGSLAVREASGSIGDKGFWAVLLA